MRGVFVAKELTFFFAIWRDVGDFCQVYRFEVLIADNGVQLVYAELLVEYGGMEFDYLKMWNLVYNTTCSLEYAAQRGEYLCWKFVGLSSEKLVK